MNKEYKDYLNSTAWRIKRKELFKRRGRACERCGTIKNIQVHHKTYDRIFNEDFSDLEILCKNCHRLQHRLTKSLGYSKRSKKKKKHKRRKQYKPKLDKKVEQILKYQKIYDSL